MALTILHHLIFLKNNFWFPQPPTLFVQSHTCSLYSYVIFLHHLLTSSSYIIFLHHLLTSSSFYVIFSKAALSVEISYLLICFNSFYLSSPLSEKISKICVLYCLVLLNITLFLTLFVSISLLALCSASWTLYSAVSFDN